MWDDQLSYLLTPALAAYELERVTGKCFRRLKNISPYKLKWYFLYTSHGSFLVVVVVVYGV